MQVQADFSRDPGQPFNRLVLPGSTLTVISPSPLQGGGPGRGLWRFNNLPRPSGYTNAQLDDYQGKPRRHFPWRPPLTLTVRARFSHPSGTLRGTAGFGFWNDPFLMTGARPPALPRAIWFFYGSPHTNLPLALDVPGHGWKAATVDAFRPLFFLLAPTAPLAILLMNIRPLYRALWPIGQKALGASEVLVGADMTAWHTYRLEWGTRRAVFAVDEQVVLDCDTPPRGPLGFVVWIDNQALVATPQGRFRWRALPLDEEQWMEIDHLEITGA
jgi:hypothetical protein